MKQNRLSEITLKALGVGKDVAMRTDRVQRGNRFSEIGRDQKKEWNRFPDSWAPFNSTNRLEEDWSEGLVKEWHNKQARSGSVLFLEPVLVGQALPSQDFASSPDVV